MRGSYDEIQARSANLEGACSLMQQNASTFAHHTLLQSRLFRNQSAGPNRRLREPPEAILPQRPTD